MGFISIVVPFDGKCPDFQRIVDKVYHLNLHLKRESLPVVSEILFVINQKEYEGKDYEIERRFYERYGVSVKFLKGGKEQHASIFKGICYAEGEIICVMDCDYSPYFFLEIIKHIWKHDLPGDDFAFIGFLKRKHKLSELGFPRFFGTHIFYLIVRTIIFSSLIFEMGKLFLSSQGEETSLQKLTSLRKLLFDVDGITTFSVISRKRAEKLKSTMSISAECEGSRKYSNYLVALIKEGRTHFFELPDNFIDRTEKKSSGYNFFDLTRLAFSTLLDLLK